MKNLTILLLLAFTVAITSCSKEDDSMYQAVQEAEAKSDSISIYGTWTLVDGKMYVENLDTQEMTVYEHFDGSKTTSSLRYSGAIYDIENISAGVTTWEFIAPPNGSNIGEFILNVNTATPYGFNNTQSFWSIIENPSATTAAEMQMGGSARPISAVIDDSNANTVIFTIQEAYESVDGENITYHSELRFQKII